MPVIFQCQIQRYDLHLNRKVLYIYGDNEERRGLGGLAGECRGEPNSLGIVTKRWPSWDDDAMWSDADYDRVVPLIDADLAKAFRFVSAGGTVVVPAVGIGQHRARLPEVAPRIDAYIKSRFVALRAL